MSEINYISRHLLSKIKDIDLKLSTKSKEIISRKTSEITKHLTRFEDLKFKKYNELKLGYDYLLEENDIDIKLGKSISTFENTTEILSKLNKKTVIQLLLKKSDGFEDNYKIKIEIYYDKTNEKKCLLININKLMTRLWNLFKLFIKNNDSKIYSFKMYLYSKPKTANINLYGKQYLEELNSIRCFNSQNGVTDKPGFGTISVISRLEESISLLTHEFLHVVSLNNAPNLAFNLDKDGSKIFWKDKFRMVDNIDKIDEPSQMEINEIFTNSFTTIYHAYLISKEIDSKSDEFKLENIIKYEIMYSIILSIRLSKISDISIKDIYNRDNLINNNNIEFGE